MVEHCAMTAAVRCALGASGGQATADDVLACAAAYAEIDCRDFFNGLPPAACERVVLGHKANQEPCFVGGECSSGFCDKLGFWKLDDLHHTKSFCGSCYAASSEGEACAHDIVCLPYLYCDALTWTCKRMRGEGDPCGFENGDSRQCEEPLSCHSTDGVCYRRLEHGEPCEPWAHPVCASAYCDPETLLCAQMPIVAVGAPCNVDFTKSSWLCSDGAVCKQDDPYTSEGVCVPVREEGEACDDDGKFDPGGTGPFVKPTPCRSPLYCLDGTCQRVRMCCDDSSAKGDR
jgi:hypothetical protein